MCFINHSKACDCVDHSIMWNVTRKIGVPEQIVQLIGNLYENQEAQIRTEHGDTEIFGIGKGMRQGCILSPYLFNMYSEFMMRKANLNEMEKGIIIGGRKINNLRYADDTTLMAKLKEELVNVLTQAKKSSAEAGLYLNLKKTKVMATNRSMSSNWEIKTLNRQQFNFFGIKNRG